MAEVQMHSSDLMPGSIFSAGHNTSNATSTSIYHPPAPSPGPRLNNATPSRHHSRAGRSTSSIPRPVSRSEKENGSVRKRPRLDNYAYSSSYSNIDSALSTPRAESRAQNPVYGSCQLDGESEYDVSYFSAANSVKYRDATSPPPFVNTTYEISGGLDTPGASFEKRQEEWGDREEELDWRMNRYTSGREDTGGLKQRLLNTNGALRRRPQPPRTPSSVSGYGQKRALEDSPIFQTPAELSSEDDPAAYTASGWHIRSRAWAMTGGLAFKAINFCWNTAFRGFSAGGGQSFAMDIGTPEVPQHGFRVSQVAAHEDVFSNQYERQENVPGGFPGDSQMDDYLTTKLQSSDSNRDTSTPTWQGQDDTFGSEMKGGWLMVDKPSTNRRRSRASMAGSRSNSSRQITTSRASVGGTGGYGASIASPRSRTRPSLAHTRSISNTSIELSPARRRPSLVNNAVYQRETPTQQTMNPQLSPTKRLSAQQPNSPSALSPDVIRFEKKLRKKARAEDESMSRMNAHLQELIRQGKEALGSKISIEDDEEDDDEGFYEDGSDDDYRRGTTGRGVHQPMW